METLIPVDKGSNVAVVIKVEQPAINFKWLKKGKEMKAPATSAELGKKEYEFEFPKNRFGTVRYKVVVGHDGAHNSIFVFDVPSVDTSAPIDRSFDEMSLEMAKVDQRKPRIEEGLKPETSVMIGKSITFKIKVEGEVHAIKALHNNVEVNDRRKTVKLRRDGYLLTISNANATDAGMYTVDSDAHLSPENAASIARRCDPFSKIVAEISPGNQGPCKHQIASSASSSEIMESTEKEPAALTEAMIKLQALKEGLKTKEALDQFELIQCEYTSLDEQECTYKCLSVIDDLEHFLHTTRQLSPANEWSGLHFLPSGLIIIFNALTIAPKMYNTVGKEVLKNSIQEFLESSENAGVFDKLMDRLINGYEGMCNLYEGTMIHVSVASGQIPEQAVVDAIRSKQFASMTLREFFHMLKTWLKSDDMDDIPITISTPGGCHALIERLRDMMDLLKAAKQSLLLGPEKNLRIKCLYDSIDKYARYRKEDLILAAFVARRYELAMESYLEAFDGVQDTDMLNAAIAMADRMYTRTYDPNSKKGSAQQYRMIEEYLPNNQLAILECMANHVYNHVNTFANGKMERLKFHFHSWHQFRILRHVLDVKNPREFNIEGKFIFKSIASHEGERLRRVMDASTLAQIKNAVILMKNKDLIPYVNKPDDFATMIEMVKLGDQSWKILVLIKEVEEVLTAFEWPSVLSKCYHYNKHKHEFLDENGKACTPTDYFNKHAEAIIKEEHKFKVGTLYGQYGHKVHSFTRVTQDGIHVGFSDANMAIIKSHYKR